MTLLLKDPGSSLDYSDMLLCPVVEGAPAAVPPASPSPGNCFVVAAGATGAWAGQDGALAAYTDGGWRFVAPIDGACVLDRVSGQNMVRREGAWETGIVRAQEARINGQPVLRERQAGIADPTGGAVVDAECRSAVAGVLAALRLHGLIDE
jgi:hypothetical protein